MSMDGMRAMKTTIGDNETSNRDMHALTQTALSNPDYSPSDHLHRYLQQQRQIHIDSLDKF